MCEGRVQRRLAAILAADVVGYTRLMGADETGTLARLKTLLAEIFEPEIETHNGRIVKTTGDGVLVEFASAVDAVQCAMVMQPALAARNAGVPDYTRIDLRIGVNLGDIIVDGDDIHGDGVNIAARLEGIADPGGIRISGAVYEQVKSKVEAGFEDLGPHDLKNVAEPVRVYAIGNAPDTEPHKSTVEEMFARPAIAVLPFANMSGDPEQEYFADGLTEDVITVLSLWRSFPVIARDSTFAYKGASPDIRKVGEELGARYVLEGSVRKSGSRVRVTGQLIDAETGHHVWAERLDRGLEDIFDLQDELTARIAATRMHATGPARRSNDDRTSRMPTTSYYILASALGHLGRADEARRALDQCEEIQPGFVARRASWRPYRDAADNEHILDGIHSAGWTLK